MTWRRMKYPPIDCACGRTFGTNVFKQHARKCTPMLKEWAKDPKCAIYLLDERSAEEKARDPIRPVEINWWLVFDPLFCDGKFEEADAKLKSLDPAGIEDPAELICVLTVTYWAKEHLPSRPAFLHKAEGLLVEKLGAERAERLLKNRR